MKLVAVIALSLLVLTGCAAPEAPAETPEAVSYPVGFPSAHDVPLFDGPLLHFAHPGNLWAAWVGSEDLVADLATASQLLLKAGYQQTVTADGYAEFQNPDRTLRIVASVDAQWGSCLMYTFTDGAIEPTDAGEQDAQQTDH